MSTQNDRANGDGRGFIDRARQRFTHAQPQPEDCAHPHARLVDADGTGQLSMVLVCEQCGRPLDAHDPTLQRKQRPRDAKVCVDCGGTYWTVGTRRSV